MPNEYIKGGYILLSRRLIESEIWDMPPLYLKVWIYILTKARHNPEKNFERGEMLISIPELQDACSHKVGFRVQRPKKHEIDNILRWLRKTHEGQSGNDNVYDNEYGANTSMITTTKTTRGMRLKVLNYNVYQDPKNYEYDSEYDNVYEPNTTTNTTPDTTMVRRTPSTIHKNVKNYKNDKNVKNDKNYHKELGDVVVKFEELGFGVINSNKIQQLNDWLEHFSPEVIIQAMVIADNQNKSTLNYLSGILKNWKARGLDTLEKIEAEQNRFYNEKAPRSERMKNRPGEARPAWLDEPEEKKVSEKEYTENNDSNEEELEELLSYFRDAKSE